jgi:hypothetical protein
MGRRLLQAAVLLAGIVPVSAGLAGVLLGPGIAGGGGGTDLDSHVRYLSGLLLGIGLTFWSLVPRIERHTTVFRVLTLIVVVGGLGRLLGVFVTGVASAPMTAALGMELVVTPLLCWWQGRVARLSTI